MGNNTNAVKSARAAYEKALAASKKADAQVAKANQGGIKGFLFANADKKAELTEAADKAARELEAAKRHLDTVTKDNA